MNFFNIDLHISVIEDIKCIFKELGHNVESVSLSGHRFVFNLPRKPLDIINEENWRSINSEMCNNFYNRYKDELKEYDGFICTYPPAFSMLYEKFNKPIIIFAPIRYEHPYTSNKDGWDLFNEKLRSGYDNKKIFLIANSVYDQKYCEYYINRPCLYIPNLCDYNNTYPKWTGNKNQIIQYNKSEVKSGVPTIGSLGGYSWKTLQDYKAVLHIPYNISTMSQYEQYTANMPMIFPSLDFLISMRKDYKQNVLSEITWYQIICKPQPNDGSPNAINDFDNLKKWVSFAEYYNKDSMPYLVYFNSLAELDNIINRDRSFFAEASEKMKTFNIKRRVRIIEWWKEFLKQI